jgi:putative peptidoglycan lipid II flippase
MVKRFFELIEREISGLHEAAYLLGFFAFLSQLLGFLRDRLLASHFGAGELLDVYYAAFRIPDFIFIWGASMVSLSVLIPVLSKRVAESKESARRFLDAVFTLFSLFVVVLCAVAFILAPKLSTMLFPGFTETQHDLVISLMRIMLFQPVFLAISNLYASITQLERRFFVYALSPLLYNLGIILGILFLYPLFGLTGLAWGVVLGALLHFSIQIPVIVRSRLCPRITFTPSWSDMRSVVCISLPRTFALSAQNLSVLVLTMFGSLFGVGSIAVFNLSWNLQAVPLAIVGASYSVAAFPTLSGLWSKGQRAEFLGTLLSAVRHIVLWSLPALVLFIVLRAQIVRTVLGTGSFDWNDTRLTAAALALFAVSIVAQSIILLFTRAFYAARKTLVPVSVALVGAVSTITGAVFFSRLLESTPMVHYFLVSLLRVEGTIGATVLVLPLSYSIGASISALLFLYVFKREFGGLGKDTPRAFWESFASSVLMGFAAYLILNLLDDIFDLHTTLGIFFQGLGAGVGGLIVGVLILYVLGNREIREIWRALHHKIWKAKVIGPDQTEATF